MDGLERMNITLLDEGITVQHFVKTIIASESLSGEQNAFLVADLGELVHKHRRFVQELPRVKPFYAVKCNSTKELLQTLIILGTGFDCASKGEIDMMLGMGVLPDDIVYANPCKQPSHIRHAAKHGVRKMTFDCESELMKVAENHQEAEMILRIMADDSESMCCLSRKYGASLEKCESLLETAKSLDIQVLGVSFHIGSGNKNPHVYNQAISDAREVFDIGLKLGLKLKLLDIGGGLPGTDNSRPGFEKFAAVIMESLDHYFPCDEDYEIIAEPGRYYAMSVFTSAVNIIAKKKLEAKTKTCESRFAYYLNDGIFGSFMEGLVLKATFTPELVPVKVIEHAQSLFPSTLWGPSCANTDEVINEVDLPELEIGDWLTFQNMGAYSVALRTHFNGFTPAHVYFVMNREIWQQLERQSHSMHYKDNLLNYPLKTPIQ